MILLSLNWVRVELVTVQYQEFIEASLLQLNCVPGSGQFD